MKTCANCSREVKVFLVDLNLYSGRGRRIKFKRCKRNSPPRNFCVTIILDKIVIKMKNLNGNSVCC